MRKDEPYDIPAFDVNGDKPVLYLSFGSLGSGDTGLLKRMFTTLGRRPAGRGRLGRRLWVYARTGFAIEGGSLNNARALAQPWPLEGTT